MKQDNLPKEQKTPKGVSYSGSNGAAKELVQLVYELLYQAWGLSPTDTDGFEQAETEALAQLQLYIEQSNRDGRINELKRLEPPEQYEEYARLMGSEHCRICGFNAIEFRKHINDRINALKRGSGAASPTHSSQALSTDTAGEDK